MHIYVHNEKSIWSQLVSCLLFMLPLCSCGEARKYILFDLIIHRFLIAITAGRFGDERRGETQSILHSIEEYPVEKGVKKVFSCRCPNTLSKRKVNIWKTECIQAFNIGILDMHLVSSTLFIRNLIKAISSGTGHVNTPALVTCIDIDRLCRRIYQECWRTNWSVYRSKRSGDSAPSCSKIVI
jgi:hypothetical protein